MSGISAEIISISYSFTSIVITSVFRVDLTELLLSKDSRLRA